MSAVDFLELAGARHRILFALRCIASRAGQNQAFWEQMRADLHPATQKSARIEDPGPAAQEK
jgi:hypothetical protein